MHASLRHSFLAATLASLGALGASRDALAQDATLPTTPHPRAYAVIIGANQGGQGQEPLRYAEDDAVRFAAVLRELGQHASPDLRVLLHPSGRDVVATIDDVAQKLRGHKERGEQAVFYFYYSGHARASALNLGAEEVSVALLRERLAQLPSTLSLVVLDACQSGAYARAKGAEPAADFSFNSVSKLTTQGAAVMASSSAQELSQESDELRSSYFTHHLLVGLRGAGDADGDGRVTLDEAYRYAYRRTLAATARTQVGSQHVTLQMDLAGRGDVPLTYPSLSRAKLALPAALQGQVLVTRKGSGAIAAEVQKAAGTKLLLALPAGSYEAVVREPDAQRALVCATPLQDDLTYTLDTGTCTSVKDTPTKKKGEESEIDRWAAEVGVGINFNSQGEYTDRLREFGYDNKPGLFELDTPPLRVSLGASRAFNKYFRTGVVFHTLTRDQYRRTFGASKDEFRYTSYGADLYFRGDLFLVEPMLSLYALAGLGLGVAPSTYTTTINGAGRDTSAVDWGPLLSGAGGVSVSIRNAAFRLQGGYEYAPVLKNRLGDVLNVGGPSVMFAVELRTDR